jgi:hypothetical protein
MQGEYDWGAGASAPAGAGGSDLRENVIMLLEVCLRIVHMTDTAQGMRDRTADVWKGVSGTTATRAQRDATLVCMHALHELRAGKDTRQAQRHASTLRAGMPVAVHMAVWCMACAGSMWRGGQRRPTAEWDMRCAAIMGLLRMAGVAPGSNTELEVTHCGAMAVAGGNAYMWAWCAASASAKEEVVVLIDVAKTNRNPSFRAAIRRLFPEMHI